MGIISAENLRHAGSEVRVKEGEVFLITANKIVDVAPSNSDAQATGLAMLKAYDVARPSNDRVAQMQRLLAAHQKFAAAVKDAVYMKTDYTGPLAAVHDHLAELERFTHPGRKYSGRRVKNRSAR